MRAKHLNYWCFHEACINCMAREQYAKHGRKRLRRQAPHLKFKSFLSLSHSVPRFAPASGNHYFSWCRFPATFNLISDTSHVASFLVSLKNFSSEDDQIVTLKILETILVNNRKLPLMIFQFYASFHCQRRKSSRRCDLVKGLETSERRQGNWSACLHLIDTLIPNWSWASANLSVSAKL